MFEVKGKGGEKTQQDGSARIRKTYNPKSGLNDSGRPTKKANLDNHESDHQMDGDNNVNNTDEADNANTVASPGSVPISHQGGSDQNVHASKGKGIVDESQSSLQHCADRAGCSNLQANVNNLNLDQNPSVRRMDPVYGPDMVIEVDPCTGLGSRLNLMDTDNEHSSGMLQGIDDVSDSAETVYDETEAELYEKKKTYEHVFQNIVPECPLSNTANQNA